MAPKVRALFDRYGLCYHTAPLPAQVYSAWHKTVRLAFPNGWWETTTKRNLPSQLLLLRKIVKADERTRRRLLKELEARAAAR